MVRVVVLAEWLPKITLDFMQRVTSSQGIRIICKSKFYLNRILELCGLFIVQSQTADHVRFYMGFHLCLTISIFTLLVRKQTFMVFVGFIIFQHSQDEAKGNPSKQSSDVW